MLQQISTVHCIPLSPTVSSYQLYLYVSSNIQLYLSRCILPYPTALKLKTGFRYRYRPTNTLQGQGRLALALGAGRLITWP